MSTKRLARAGWVVAANGIVAYLTVSRFLPIWSDSEVRGSPAVWFEIVLEVLLPLIGIVLELFGHKLAKWMNIGYPLLAALFWFVGAAYDHSDPFFGVLILIGIGMLILAGLMAIAYWGTKALDEKRRT